MTSWVPWNFHDSFYGYHQTHVKLECIAGKATSSANVIGKHLRISKKKTFASEIWGSEFLLHNLKWNFFRKLSEIHWKDYSKHRCKCICQFPSFFIYKIVFYPRKAIGMGRRKTGISTVEKYENSINKLILDGVLRKNGDSRNESTSTSSSWRISVWNDVLDWKMAEQNTWGWITFQQKVLWLCKLFTHLLWKVGRTNQQCTKGDKPNNTRQNQMSQLNKIVAIEI